MTAEDLIELRDYAKSLEFNVFERWKNNEYIISMPQCKEFNCDNWIIDCTYHNKDYIDIINKRGIKHLFEREEIDSNYRTYKVKNLNLKTMKRWLNLMKVISKNYEIKKKLEKIEGDF
jgi:hypothetical protein